MRGEQDEEEEDITSNNDDDASDENKQAQLLCEILRRLKKIQKILEKTTGNGDFVMEPIGSREHWEDFEMKIITNNGNFKNDLVR